jgi:integrase
MALPIFGMALSQGKMAFPILGQTLSQIRDSKNHKDRMVPIAQSMIEDLRKYWAVHHHPLLIFPSIGRGDNDVAKTAERMRAAHRPIPVSSLERLMVAARKELGIELPPIRARPSMRTGHSPFHSSRFSRWC